MDGLIKQAKALKQVINRRQKEIENTVLVISTLTTLYFLIDNLSDERE